MIPILYSHHSPSQIHPKITRKEIAKVDHFNSSISHTNTTASNLCDEDYNCVLWKIILEQKLRCFGVKKCIMYLYHMRKTAGTLIRLLLMMLTRRAKVTFLESEGQVLNPDFLNQYGILSTVSLRHPVDRIISLYWYEHVTYYYKVQKKPGKSSNLRTWVMHWRDNSTWKQNLTSRYPGNVYIEVENYYVKALSGWTGDHQIDENDLMKAKETLQKFDLVFLSELMNKGIQDDVFRSFFKVPNRKLPTSLASDKRLISQLKNILASDEKEIRTILTDINKYDLELYKFAKTMVVKRLPVIASVMAVTHHPPTKYQNENLYQFEKRNNVAPIFQDINHEKVYNRILSLRNVLGLKLCHANITVAMNKTFGYIRPIGHKLPVNTSWIEPPPSNKTTTKHKTTKANSKYSDAIKKLIKEQHDRARKKQLSQ